MDPIGTETGPPASRILVAGNGSRVTAHQSPATVKSFTMRTYAKTRPQLLCNLHLQIIGLKVSWNEQLQKTRGGWGWTSEVEKGGKNSLPGSLASTCAPPEATMEFTAKHLQEIPGVPPMPRSRHNRKNGPAAPSLALPSARRGGLRAGRASRADGPFCPKRWTAPARSRCWCGG